MITVEATATTPWLDGALLRQGLYRLLAGVFQRPDIERTELLRHGAAVLLDMAVADFPFAGAVLPLLDDLQHPGDALATDVEHVRLFESGVDGALCPPTESYWLADSVGSVIGQLQRDCLQLGLGARHEDTLEPDHVATLLEVQSVLCSREAQGWDARDRDAVILAVRNERWFLERHLGRWVSAFARRLDRTSTVAPFDRAGGALAAVVRSDRQLLTALADQLDVARP